MAKKYGYVKGKGYSLHNLLTEPEDYEAKFKMNIVMFDEKSINGIVKECLPHAKGSEFQVHYHSLQAHINNGNYEVVVTVPLTFYNFNQVVSTGSVELKMKDENEEALACKPIAEGMMKEAFKKLPILEHLKGLGFGVKYTFSNNGSIHRHPGDFSFSSIDYDKDPEEPGVVYRQSNASNLYQVDSVIYLGNDTPKFVCTETRIVNVKPADDGGIKGTYTEIPTVSFLPKKNDNTSLDKLYEILGDDSKSNIYDGYKITTSMDSDYEFPLVEELLKAFEASDFEADISNVKGERITQERVIGYQPGKFNQTSSAKETKTKETKRNLGGWEDYGLYDYYDEWEDMVDAEYEAYQKEEEAVVTATIDNKEMIYNEDIEAWLPKCTKDFTEEEIIEYAAKHNLL